jgi:hypothetical protein
MPLLGRMRRMRRRRVLAGAALVGGTTCYAGTKGQEAVEREACQDARLDELELQGQPASAPVAAAPDTRRAREAR